jgi:hypothetical protein
MLRAYALGFSALAVFAIAYALRHHHTLHLAAKLLAGVVGFACVVLGALSTCYAIRASRVRRREEMRQN